VARPWQHFAYAQVLTVVDGGAGNVRIEDHDTAGLGQSPLLPSLHDEAVPTGRG